MSAIYVLAGEEREGPFTAEEIRESVADGRLTLEHMGWTEGLEAWIPLSELLNPKPVLDNSDESDEVVEVLAEGPGYVLTNEALRVREEVFPLEDVLKATLETEHTKRGKPIAGSIVFGVLVSMTLAMPLRPETQNHWILWGLSLLLFLFLFLRSLLMAFKPSGTFVAVHLRDGDDRVLPMSDHEAKSAVESITAILTPHGSEEGETEDVATTDSDPQAD